VHGLTRDDFVVNEHDLVVLVRDEVSGASFEAREPFRVER
jgi:hypothetical protein